MFNSLMSGANSLMSAIGGGGNKAVEQLVWAVKDSNPSGIKEALQAGADINGVCDGRTALHCACYAGNVEMTTLLLDSNANPNVEVDGGTPLHDACERGYVEIVKVLLQRGADINKLNEGSGTSALHWAALGGRADVVALLLEQKADATAKNKVGKTALGEPFRFTRSFCLC